VNEEKKIKVLQAVQTLSRERLLPFITYDFPKYEVNYHLKRLAEKLEKVEKGEIKRLMIVMPPRHGKSFICSQYFPAWYLGRNPTHQVIATSYADDLARDFGRKVRNLIKSPLYEKLFGLTISEDSASQSRLHTQQGGVYVSTGIGGAITGRGADLAIIDDFCKNREQADSITYRNKVWDWYSSTLRTRLMPKGAIVVIATRWHKDDLIGRLLNGGEKWEMLHFPAINDKGEALWETRYPVTSLEDTRKAITARDWHCLYQGVPADPEKQIFHAEMFKYWHELPQGDLVMTIDPAFSNKESADCSCILVAMKSGNKTYVIEYINEKLLPNALIDKIVAMYKKWQPAYVGIEAVAAQTIIGYYLKERMASEGIQFSYEEIRQKEAKEQKILKLEPFIRQGLIIWHRSHTELEQQMLEFPLGEHDDIIDALQMTFQFKLGGQIQTLDVNITYNEFGEPVY